jgi:hypothetical protein
MWETGLHQPGQAGKRPPASQNQNGDIGGALVWLTVHTGRYLSSAA